MADAHRARVNFSGSITGPGYLIYGGAWNPGALTLSGNNSFTGPVYAGGGTIILGSATGLGATSDLELGSTLDLNGFSITVGGMDVNSGGTITNNGAALATVTVVGTPGTWSDFDGLIENGSAQVALSIENGYFGIANTDTFTGGVTVDAGAILFVGWDNTNGSIQSNVLDNGGLIFAPTVTTVYSGNISGVGTVWYDGQWNSGTFTLSGDNTFTGNFSIGPGTLIAGSSTALGSSSVELILLNSVLNLNGQNVTVGSVQNNTATIENSGTGEATMTIGTTTYDYPGV